MTTPSKPRPKATKRSRTEGHVWLKALPTDTSAGRTWAPESVERNLHTNLATLMSNFGLYVEMQSEGGRYFVRCYPHRPGGIDRWYYPAATFVSADLRTAAAGAVVDYLRYQKNRDTAVLANREYLRWVD